MAATDSSDERLAPPEAEAFYRDVLRTLKDAGIPFLVGGAYAFVKYTGIDRRTKDFDLFVRPDDVRRAFAVLEEAGYRTDLTFPHWLGKARLGNDCIDVIYSSGNGVAAVDDDLNKLRVKDFLRYAEEAGFEIVHSGFHIDDAQRQYLTPEIREELSDYSEDELLTIFHSAALRKPS